MMSNTDPRYVFLCYDTGHFTFAGEDPLAMLKKYVDRVGHVHLKDMRLPVVEEARKNNWSFLQSVRNGAFTVPGDGNVDFDPVFKVPSRAVPTSGSTPVCKSRDGRTPVLPTAFPYHFLTSNRRCFQ